MDEKTGYEAARRSAMTLAANILCKTCIGVDNDG